METRMKTDEFFNQQFRRKTHAGIRLVFLAIAIEHLISTNFALDIYAQMSVNIAALLTAFIVVPLFDVYILKDPLHTETTNPSKYWILGFFGDYQTILDGLNGAKRQAQHDFEIAENLYLSKANRFLKKHGRPYNDPTINIIRKPGHEIPHNPPYLLILFTAICIIAINHSTDLLPESLLSQYPLLSNMGLKLIVMYLFVFKLIPVVMGNENGNHSYAFWQNVWMGQFDLRVKNITDEISYINRKKAALTQASAALDAIL